MRAALLRGARIDIEQLADPMPGPGQVLVAPHATGICGSDLHLREVLAVVAADGSVPIVPGHELAGEIIAIGPGTETDLRVGDLVTANPFTHGPSGPETVGLSPVFTGALAELTCVDAARTIRLPDGLDCRLGALSEPLAVAVHATARASASGPIAVIGAGPIGLAVIAVCVITGRGPVVVVEPSSARRDMARRLGADAVHEPGTPITDLLAEVGFTPSTISPLLDADPAMATIFECAGRPDVVASILATAPPHSRVVLAGACTHPVEISPLALTTGEISVEASYAYRQHELVTAVTLLHQHPDRFRPLITSERPLEATAQAFDDLAGDPSELKILIRPNGDRP